MPLLAGQVVAVFVGVADADVEVDVPLPEALDAADEVLPEALDAVAVDEGVALELEAPVPVRTAPHTLAAFLPGCTELFM